MLSSTNCAKVSDSEEQTHLVDEAFVFIAPFLLVTISKGKMRKLQQWQMTETKITLHNSELIHSLQNTGSPCKQSGHMTPKGAKTSNRGPSLYNGFHCFCKTNFDNFLSAI